MYLYHDVCQVLGGHRGRHIKIEFSNLRTLILMVKDSKFRSREDWLVAGKHYTVHR
jgi:hypothetical protein